MRACLLCGVKSWGPVKSNIGERVTGALAALGDTGEVSEAMKSARIDTSLMEHMLECDNCGTIGRKDLIEAKDETDERSFGVQHGEPVPFTDTFTDSLMKGLTAARAVTGQPPNRLERILIAMIHSEGAWESAARTCMTLAELAHTVCQQLDQIEALKAAPATGNS